MATTSYVSLSLPYHIAASPQPTDLHTGGREANAAAFAESSLDSRFSIAEVRQWSAGFLPVRMSTSHAFGGSDTGLAYYLDGNAVCLWDLAADACLKVEVGPTAITALHFALESVNDPSGRPVTRHALYAAASDRLVRAEFGSAVPTLSAGNAGASPTTQTTARPLYHGVLSPLRSDRANGSRVNVKPSVASSSRTLTLFRFTSTALSVPAIGVIASPSPAVKRIAGLDGSLWTAEYDAASQQLRVVQIVPLHTLWAATKSVWSWFSAAKSRAVDAIGFPSGVVVLSEDRAVTVWAFLAHGAVRHEALPLPGDFKGDLSALQLEGEGTVVVVSTSGMRCYLKVSASEQRATAVSVMGVKPPPSFVGPLVSGATAVSGAADASTAAFVWNQTSANQTFLLAPRQLMFEPTAAGQLRELVVALPARAPGDLFLGAWVALSCNIGAETLCRGDVSVLVASVHSGITRIHVAGASSTLLRGLTVSPHTGLDRAVAALGKPLVAQLLLRTVLDSHATNVNEVAPFFDRLCVPTVRPGPAHPVLGATAIVTLSPAVVAFRQQVELFLEDESLSASPDGGQGALERCRLLRDAGTRLFGGQAWADAANAPHITDACCLSNTIDEAVVLAQCIRDPALDPVNVQAKLLHSLLSNLTDLSELLVLCVLARGTAASPKGIVDRRVPLRQWLYDGQTRLETAITTARTLTSSSAPSFASLRDVLRRDDEPLRLLPALLFVELDIWEQLWVECAQSGAAPSTLYGNASATEIALAHAIELVADDGSCHAIERPLGGRGMALLWATAINALRHDNPAHHSLLPYCEANLIATLDRVANDAATSPGEHDDDATGGRASQMATTVDITAQILGRLPPSSPAVRVILTHFLTLRPEPHQGDFAFAEVFAALPREAVRPFLVPGSPFTACWRDKHEDDRAAVCDAFLDVADGQPASLLLRRRCIDRAAAVLSSAANASPAAARLADFRRRLTIQQQLVAVVQSRVENALNVAQHAAAAHTPLDEDALPAEGEGSALPPETEDAIRRMSQQLNVLLQGKLLTMSELFATAQSHVHFGGEHVVLDILASEAAAEEAMWVDALEAAVFKNGATTAAEAAANCEAVVRRIRVELGSELLPLPYVISALEATCTPPDTAANRLKRIGVGIEDLVKGYLAIVDGHAATYAGFQSSVVSLLATLAELCRQLPPGSEAAQQCLSKVDTKTRKLQSDVQRGTVVATSDERRALEGIRQRLADFETTVANNKVALRQRSLFF